MDERLVQAGGFAWCSKVSEEERISSPYWSRIIKQIRERSNLSQIQLAELLQTKQANISRWESGGITPKREFQERLEGLATDLGIQSLQGLLLVVRASPFPMLLTDREGLIVGASASSGFSEGLSVLEQTPIHERSHLVEFREALEEQSFWSSGGNRYDYCFQTNDQIFAAVVVSVEVQGVTFSIVQRVDKG